jgi:arabinose-5-phosphate isomerase
MISNRILSLKLILFGKDVLRNTANALPGPLGQIGEKFVNALKLMLHSCGRMVVSGICKSGHVTRKNAASMANTGAPRFYCIQPNPQTATSA